MPSISGRSALFVAAISLGLSFPACGKKAPLRLIDDRSPQSAPTLRARVREGRVTLDFRVPAHRVFPEREDPWVLARILRQATPASVVIEAGAILKAEGFAFDAPLTWSDQVQPPHSSFSYRVEFRDAVRRRRALSEPLAVSWDLVPDAPPTLTAESHLRSIVLSWTTPTGTGINYRIYRRDMSQALFEPISPDLVTTSSSVDSRIESDRDYCYVVRAVLSVAALEIEGPASPESCSRTAAEEPITP